jgi:hypothetical protein
MVLPYCEVAEKTREPADENMSVVRGQPETGQSAPGPPVRPASVARRKVLPQPARGIQTAKACSCTGRRISLKTSAPNRTSDRVR